MYIAMLEQHLEIVVIICFRASFLTKSIYNTHNCKDLITKSGFFSRFQICHFYPRVKPRVMMHSTITSQLLLSTMTVVLTV